MKLIKSILFPFRFFASGETLVKKSRPAGPGRGQAGPPGELGKPQHVDKPKMKIGWKYGNFLATSLAFLITTGVFVYLLAFIEQTPDFTKRYGRIGLESKIEKVGIPFPEGERSVFYRSILSKAVCASEVSIVQVVLLYGVLYAGLRLVLRIFGHLSSNEKTLKVSGTRSLMSMAMIMLPALGILSTVIGILSTGEVSREEAKLIIFGPSGLGILGYLIATGFYSLADYFDER